MLMLVMGVEMGSWKAGGGRVWRSGVAKKKARQAMSWALGLTGALPAEIFPFLPCFFFLPLTGLSSGLFSLPHPGINWDCCRRRGDLCACCVCDGRLFMALFWRMTMLGVGQSRCTTTFWWGFGFFSMRREDACVWFGVLSLRHFDTHIYTWAFGGNAVRDIAG